MHRFIPIVLTAAALAAGPVSGSQCPSFRQGTVEGVIKTVNINQQLQYGVAQIRIVRRGSDYFASDGVIIGEMTGQQGNGLPIFAHSAFFRDGNRLQTENDLVTTFVPTGTLDDSGQPCEFAVEEKITTATGTKKLQALSNDQHDITATGTVSYCPGNNRNNLVLSGTVCFGR